MMFLKMQYQWCKKFPPPILEGVQIKERRGGEGKEKGKENEKGKKGKKRGMVGMEGSGQVGKEIGKRGSE